MNDTDRTNIFNKDVVDTPELWAAFKEAVTAVRNDIQATDATRHGAGGKWAVRYPNGDRPANMADCTFMANARLFVLNMMSKIEAQEMACAKAISDLTATHDGHVASLQEKIDALNATLVARDEQIKNQGEILANMQRQIDSLSATAEPTPEPVSDVPALAMAEADKANMAPAKPKRKRLTKAEAGRIQNPDSTAQPLETAEGALNP